MVLEKTVRMFCSRLYDLKNAADKESLRITQAERKSFS